MIRIIAILFGFLAVAFGVLLFVAVAFSIYQGLTSSPPPLSIFE